VELSSYLVRCLRVKTWNSVELSTCMVRCLKVTAWNRVELSTCLCLANVWRWTQWNCQRVLVPQKQQQQHSFPSTCMKPKSTVACPSSPFSISESWWRFCPDPYSQQWNHQAIAPLAVAKWWKKKKKSLVCFSLTGDLITSCLSGASLAVRCSIFWVFSTVLQF